MIYFLAQTQQDAEGWLKLLISNFGAPTALALVFVFALYRGWVRLGREVDREKEVYEKRLKDSDDRYASLKEESEERLALMRDEKEKYLNLLIRHQDLAERAVTAAQRATDKIPT
jgi:wyosine [tRNA(Phe)-imidazoG37] synthetase (radical SAM superfamily)